MSRRFTLPAGLAVLATAHLTFPEACQATQAHGSPEGLLAHQLAHLFFIVSMGILIYWLRQRNLVTQKGWRSIQYAALFFIFWNLGAFSAHLLDEQFSLVAVSRISPWRIRIDTVSGGSALAWFYYILKLDHLLCVPAMCFLFAGLRRLLKSAPISGGAQDTP